MEIITDGLDTLDGVAKQIIEYADGRTVWLFTGEIGAGKTTLIKRICYVLGVDEKVTSPTFSIVNQYDGSSGTIYHLDLYRLENIEEAIDIGIEDLLYGTDLVLIEWPGIIDPLLPANVLDIKIEITEDANRKILLS